MTFLLAALGCLFAVKMALAEQLVLASGSETLSVEIAEVKPVFMHGLPSIQFVLTETSGEAMATLTEAMIGEPLTVSLCGHDLVRAVVRERIEGRGVINLPDIEAAVATVEVLNGNGDCASLAAHFPD